jgi:xylulokinase
MGAAFALATVPGWPVMSLGTFGKVCCVTEVVARDESGIVAGFADATGRFRPLAATLTATLAVADWLGIDRDATEPGGEVVVLPSLDGERTPNLPTRPAP